MFRIIGIFSYETNDDFSFCCTCREYIVSFCLRYLPCQYVGHFATSIILFSGGNAQSRRNFLCVDGCVSELFQIRIGIEFQFEFTFELFFRHIQCGVDTFLYFSPIQREVVRSRSTANCVLVVESKVCYM